MTKGLREINREIKNTTNTLEKLKIKQIKLNKLQKLYEANKKFTGKVFTGVNDDYRVLFITKDILCEYETPILLVDIITIRDYDCPYKKDMLQTIEMMKLENNSLIEYDSYFFAKENKSITKEKFYEIAESISNYHTKIINKINI